ncbi:MAG TPA: alpha/beta fold hydrolase [Coleofasciculaceae cyanobacterium]|jgi:medium-chain acyl-[acyl-carrier-protein] hydrolase
MTFTPHMLNRWIKCITPNPDADLRLFCFHYAGGNASVFRTWSNHILDRVEVYSVELPGHGTRLMEPAFDRMQPLIHALKAALSPSLTQPFAFFGHSMGALISYELGQALRQNHDLCPTHLFISGHRAPHIPDQDLPIHALPQAEFLDTLRRYNGTPEIILQNAELMELLLPTLRADFALVETYTHMHQFPLDCPITVFGGLQDWKTSINDLEAWRGYTRATFSLQMLPGDHFFIHSRQALLLQALNAAISRHC